MAIFRSTQVAAGQPPITPTTANAEVTAFGDWAVPASGLASGDIVEMLCLPAGCVPVSVIVDHDNLGSAFTAAVGLLSGQYRSADQSRTCDASLVAAATYQAAAIKTLNVAGGTRIAPVWEIAGTSNGSVGDRGIGLVISGTLTSPTAGARVRITVKYRATIDGA